MVIIDAGHGGADPGSISRSGVREKTVALGIALAAARALEGREGLEVRLLRDDDTFLPLWDRGALATEMKKQVVEVYEYPGYVTTRLIIPLINEAAYALMEGVATAEGIDTAMKLGFGFPAGPLELADNIGLDEVMRRMEGMFSQLGDFKYRPCPLLRMMVREKKLGRKTGEGFFKYSDTGEDKK